MASAGVLVRITQILRSPALCIKYIFKMLYVGMCA